MRAVLSSAYCAGYALCRALCFFFFQAEDGIRDKLVTGVQTCALPIWGGLARATGLEEGALDTALDELEWQRWLAAEGRGYSFVARIVRDVVARDLVTEGQRRRIREAASR